MEQQQSYVKRVCALTSYNSIEDFTPIQILPARPGMPSPQPCSKSDFGALRSKLPLWLSALNTSEQVLQS
jgi:hypothetical protein